MFSSSTILPPDPGSSDLLEVNLDHQPSTAVLLTDRIHELVQEIQRSPVADQDSVAALEGIRVILEVLSWCQAFCTSSSLPHALTAIG